MFMVVCMDLSTWRSVRSRTGKFNRPSGSMWQLDESSGLVHQKRGERWMMDEAKFGKDQEGRKVRDRWRMRTKRMVDEGGKRDATVGLPRRLVRYLRLPSPQISVVVN